MAKSGKVLSIDITNESITIIEISAAMKKQSTVHNVIILETPEDSFEDGIIKEPDKIAQAIREQLVARGINNKNVIFVLSSTKIVNREVVIPFVKENKIRGIINSNASEYFPVNIEDYVVSHSVLETVNSEEGGKQLRVLAVAAPRQIVSSYYDLASMAGLHVVDLDYIGNAMLQLIKTQTTQNTTTMVIQLGSESTVLNIVQGDNLLLQRTVPYGTNAVVNVVMDEKGVDATTAMTLLQNDRLITVDFDDNEATGAFRYLINNIGRVMDFYATKNPDKPIEDVFLTGDGALIKGIDGLFKIQLNVQTRIMDSLYNIKFAEGIDLKVYNPVYLVAPIGAAFDPMGFALTDATKSSASEGGSLIPFVAIAVIGAVGAAALAFFAIDKNNKAVERRDQLQQDVDRLKDIEDVIAERDQAQARLEDITAMTLATYHKNERAREFITELENKIPKEIVIGGFTTSDDGVSIPCTSASYDAIADFIIQLKSMDCISDAFVSGVSETLSDDGSAMYTFSVTASYVDPAEALSQAVEEAAPEEESSETEQ